MSRSFYPVFALILGVTALGCLPTEPAQEAQSEAPAAEFISAASPTRQETPPASSEALVAEWKVLAENQSRSRLSMRHTEIAKVLASRSPEGLTPIIDVIADPESTPEMKVFASETIAGEIRPPYLERLKTLTGESLDITTRACATMLIGQMKDTDVTAELAGLAEDDERRVKMAAMVGLAQRGRDDMRQHFVAMYWDEEATQAERERIVLTILVNPAEKDFKILSDLLVRSETNLFVRTNIAHTYGRIGGTSVIDALEMSIKNTPDPSYRSMAQAAIQTIEAREETSSQDDPES